MSLASPRLRAADELSREDMRFDLLQGHSNLAAVETVSKAFGNMTFEILEFCKILCAGAGYEYLAVRGSEMGQKAISCDQARQSRAGVWFLFWCVRQGWGSGLSQNSCFAKSPKCCRKENESWTQSFRISTARPPTLNTLDCFG